MKELLQEFPIYQVFGEGGYAGASFNEKPGEADVAEGRSHLQLLDKDDIHGCLVLAIFSNTTEARVYGVACTDARGTDDVGYLVRTFDAGAACLVEYFKGCPDLTILDYRGDFETEFPRTLIASREIQDWRVAEGESLPEHERAPHRVRFDDHDQQFRFELANQFGYGLDLMIEVNRAFAMCHVGINGDDAILHLVAQGDGVVVVADGEDNIPRRIPFGYVYPDSCAHFYPKAGWGRLPSGVTEQDGEAE